MPQNRAVQKVFNLKSEVLGFNPGLNLRWAESQLHALAKPGENSRAFSRESGTIST
jgi:hypothetical protein